MRVRDFNKQRSECLLKNFRESLARQSQISIIKAFQDAAEAPVPRFWVSEARATRIILQMIKGVDLTEGMYPEKRKMYQEIYRRTCILMKENPEKPVGDIVFEIVNSPAPSSYVGWDRAKRIIRNHKHQQG